MITHTHRHTSLESDLFVERLSVGVGGSYDRTASPISDWISDRYPASSGWTVCPLKSSHCGFMSPATEKKRKKKEKKSGCYSLSSNRRLLKGHNFVPLFVNDDLMLAAFVLDLDLHVYVFVEMIFSHSKYA